MTGQLFISLLNPGIDLLFAAAFFWMWRQRHEHYVAYAAAAYAAEAYDAARQDALVKCADIVRGIITIEMLKL